MTKDNEFNPLETAREVLDIEIQGLTSVRDRLADSFLQAISLLSEKSGRVVVSGLGKSGLVGRKLAATFSSTGTPSFFLHPVEGAHGDLGMIREGDVIIAVSNSGETDELNTLLPALRSLGVAVIAMTGNPESTLARHADVVINTCVPREACPMNLAPTASTTAVLAVGDALAVCLMRSGTFNEDDFRRFHPGGTLGRRLKLKVRELMHTEDIPVTSIGSSCGEAAEILNQGGLGAVCVVEDNRLLRGILTDGDLRRAVCNGCYDPAKPVYEIMTADPKAAVPDQSVAELIDIMERSAITVLPIIDASKKLVGLIHLHDLLGKGRLTFAGM